MKRTSAAEKMEIIRIVESSGLSVKQTLAELDTPRSTFYRWYKRYQAQREAGLVDRSPRPRHCWNRIPDPIREQVVQTALEHPEQSPREVACTFTDTQQYFISEPTVYRILKAYDLVTSPAFILVSADCKFKHPTQRVNELWQTDFTQFKVVGWGFYYLSSVLDDYSRYIIAYKLTTGMAATHVQDTLDLAVAKTGVMQVKVEHRPRLLSDNGPAYISHELAAYLAQRDIRHVRGKPFHPMTQGKIERYHRSLKNVICLENHYFPWQLQEAIDEFIDFYNNRRFHEALNNLTPADMFFGRAEQILSRRDQIKRTTLIRRRTQHLLASSSA
jgi:transposase InsO family protein